MDTIKAQQPADEPTLQTGRITPFLWFNNNLAEAIDFYTSVFKDSCVLNITRLGNSSPGVEGSVMSATFELNGQRFMALNGGPMFHFTEAISFFVPCNTQDEIDGLWEKLSDGGSKGRCGWLKDKFGLSWQVVPNVLGKLLQGNKGGNSSKVMEAMLKMDKLDIALLEQAYAQ